VNGDDAPFVSIVVPARDASATLGETLDCLLAQTDSRWEAVVVDDDSTDETRAIADDFAARDGRVRVLASVAHSEGGARNVGIAQARAPWLLFLDADDLLEPQTVERLVETLTRTPDADGVVVSWVRFDDRGDDEPRHWDDRDDPFERVASYTPFAIHACIIRTSLVVDLGMFDASLYGVADWDLWQRVFRAGAKIVRLGDTLARYRSHSGAMSRDSRAMFRQSLVVIERGFSPDPRVTRPLPAYASGAPPEQRASAVVRHACWWGGGALAAGEDALAILDDAAAALAAGIAADVPVELVAAALDESIRLASLAPPSAWRSLWLDLRDAVRAFLGRLEALTGARDLAWKAQLLLRPPDEDAPTTPRADVAAVDVELTGPIPDVVPDAAVRRIVCVARLRGRALGLVELDVTEGRVGAGAITDAMCERFYWELARAHVEGRAEVRRGADSHEIWGALMHELWPASPRRRSPIRIATRRPVEIVAGRELPRILSASGDVDVVVRVGARRLGPVRVAAGDARRRSRLGRAVAAACAVDLFRAVAHEALIGRAPTSEPLSRLLPDR
jgi:GT2 family glycosyltransferase